MRDLFDIIYVQARIIFYYLKSLRKAILLNFVEFAWQNQYPSAVANAVATKEFKRTFIAQISQSGRAMSSPGRTPADGAPVSLLSRLRDGRP